MGPLYAAFFRIAAGARVEWRGVAPVGKDGPIQRVYFANHGSHLDAPVLWTALPPAVRARARPVAARDTWGTGLPAFLARPLRIVLVDRGDGPAATAAMGDALRAGDSLILFPEGTRAGEGIRPFKSGLFHVARAFPAVELVPVHLAHLGRMLPKGEVAPVPLVPRVTFGAPVPLAEGDEREPFLARARAALAALAEVP